MNKKKNFDLEDRLVKFSITIIEISENLPKTRAGNHIASQLIRSGTSTSLNYGEVQGAESRKDFIHKMKIILKELRETFICLKIIRLKLLKNLEIIKNVMNECNELISIFVVSILTAEKNKTSSAKYLK